MKREAIRLDPDKVKLLITRSGIPIKQLLDGMSAKTVHRIKAGKNTSLATAHKLASDLSVTVEALMSPVKEEEMDSFLPVQWLYDEAPSSCDKKHVQFCGAIGGYGYLVDGSPFNFNSPIEQLLKWHEPDRRKIVLRRDHQAFIFEIHYFNYSPDRERQVLYEFTTACRFFPLVRNGDTFSKAPLSDMLDRHVWGELQRKALANAEIVAIEGHAYPVHPDAYFPLVRFYQDSLLKPIAFLGARMFEQLRVDFKWSLVDYLKGIDAARVSAKTTFSGIALRVEPVKPEIWALGWRDEVIEIRVDLTWCTPAGELALAPWRHAHREQFIKGITSREWNNCDARGMPIRYFPKDGGDDPDTPPFEPDPVLSADTIAAIAGIAHPGPSRF